MVHKCWALVLTLVRPTEVAAWPLREQPEIVCG